jgi:hypothetical protein
VGTMVSLNGCVEDKISCSLRGLNRGSSSQYRVAVPEHTVIFNKAACGSLCNSNCVLFNDDLKICHIINIVVDCEVLLPGNDFIVLWCLNDI